MRSAPALVAILALCGSCDFAVKHPAATAAIAGGMLGFGTCALEVGKGLTCLEVGGIVGAGLGLVTGIAMWTMGGDDEEHVLYDPILPGGEEPIHGGATDGSPDGTDVTNPPENVNALPGPTVPKEKQTPIPRLVLPDAGVPEDAGAAPAPATPSDAAP